MKKSALILTLILVWLSVFAQNRSAALANPMGQQDPPTATSWIITSTPNPDGSIIHIVREGETLWDIAMAYGTTGAEIMTNTGNSPLATDVYVGQVLIIRLANPATQTPTLTPTPTRITPQATQARPTLTPVPTKTLSPTPTLTSEPPLVNRLLADSRSVGMTMMGISLVGIILVLIFGFLKKSK